MTEIADQPRHQQRPNLPVEPDLSEQQAVPSASVGEDAYWPWLLMVSSQRQQQLVPWKQTVEDVASRIRARGSIPLPDSDDGSYPRLMQSIPW